MSRVGEAWRTGASCAQTGAGDEWFPANGSRISRSVFRTCGDCAVWRECLVYALANPELQHGVWAGLTPREITILRARLMTGDLGADVVDEARRITEHRTSRTIYRTPVQHQVLEYAQLCENAGPAVSVLRAVGLLEGVGDAAGRPDSVA